MPPLFRIATIEHWVFSHRRLLLSIFAVITVIMAYFATQLRVDAGFNKLLPLEHEYMRTFTQYQEEFGGANRILIALMAKDGDIFTAEFFETLKAVTDEVFFIPGVDRTQVRSIFTPNVRFIEIVEDGFAGGNVIPPGFKPTPESLEQVRINILKSGQVGRLVSSDLTGAIVSAQLLEIHPTTGERLDYLHVAEQLETKIRKKYQNEAISVHIIGFAKVIGDITDGTMGVMVFFLVAFAITALLVYIYSLSLKLTVLPLLCSLVAVVWQLGLLPLLGFGIDPMSILLPFLVFAIGVSHGVQVVNSVRGEIFFGSDSITAARNSFRRLLVPGGVALISDTMGFLTILLIKIEIIQEIAITASLGVAVIILTNLFLLPVLLSYVKLNKEYRESIAARVALTDPLWKRLSRIAEPRHALVAIVIAGLLSVYGLWHATNIRIGDLHQGIPELREDSPYNLDTAVITERFAIGVDILSVIAETEPQACVRHEVMDTIDRFAWHIQNVEGVRSVMALPTLAKIINAGWNEGSLKWRVLPRNQPMMVQSVAQIETATGLLNTDCSVMPVLIFTADHKAETIDRIIAAIEKFRATNNADEVKFRLASGNVCVIAATNQVVAAAQFPMLLYVYSAVIILCLLTFKSLRATLCIVIPLALVSILTYALMTLLDIGLKVSTLPVVALGVGIGVDYGIYIYSRFRTCCDEEGQSIQEAFHTTLKLTGNAVLFTGLTLAISVSTWMFSALKFQADMGILLTFMFLLNMLGAILLLPALVTWLQRPAQLTPRR